MRSIVFTISLLLAAAPAYADTCSKNLVPTFTAAQATLVCKKGLAQVEPTSNFETAAVAGTNQGTATALAADKLYHRVTGANGTAGVRLPAVSAASVGQFHVLLNTTAGVALVYPATGQTINGGATNAVFTALTGIKPIFCYVDSASSWVCS